MRVLFFVFVCCMGCVPLRTHAQGSNANWYFGMGAGMSFSSGLAMLPLTGNAFYTVEGSACISDETGQLLFYTDGVRVFDRNHQVMPNGSGLNGEMSSSQSALIVKDLANTRLFHVFTVAAEASLSFTGYSGLSHSTVDMELNGGIGDVVLKNDPLLPLACEKLTAARHANGRDVWVVAHGFGDDSYHAYLLTCNGLQPPVVSHTGRPMGLVDSGEARGYMDISPDGRYAAAIWHRGPITQMETFLDFLSFDATTGVLVLQDSLTHAPPASPGANGNYIEGYGACFAPDSRFLYTTEICYMNGMQTSRVHQYDMSAMNIAASEVRVMDVAETYGAIACGPDGVMYIAAVNNTDSLPRILFPDLPGTACGADTAGILVQGNVALGLPNAWENTAILPAQPPTLILNDTTACGGPVQLEVHAVPPSNALLYQWNTGSTTSTTMASTAGHYVVKVISGCDTVTAQAEVRSSGRILDLGPDLELCKGTRMTAQVPTWAAQWAWSDGWNGTERSLGSAGELELAVVDSLGCLSVDTLTLDFVDCDCKPYVPNAFTPNGDGINDGWGVVMDCRHGPFHLQVFDRWGTSVFDSTEPDAHWDGTVDGTPLPPSVYAWTMELLHEDPTGTRRANHRGHVALMR